MLEHSKQKTLKSVVFCMAVFCAMLVFFTVLHPVPIMDEDDVIYTVLIRKAIPIPGAWNPSRVMPEVLTSLCGNLAALCTALGFGRFIDCQVVVLGVIFSLFITAYIYTFFRLLRVRFDCGEFAAFCLSILSDSDIIINSRVGSRITNDLRRSAVVHSLREAVRL